MLEYEMKWLGLPSLLGSMASYEGRLMKREKCNLIVDRDYYSRAKPSECSDAVEKGSSKGPRWAYREGRVAYVYQRLRNPELTSSCPLQRYLLGFGREFICV
jgi:hypothetical protein